MFGANPDWYEPYGLPGHDGLDIIAPIGRPVKSIAAGTVYMVYGSATGHNYGRHVRVQYDGGIKVVYAHLDRVDVQEGQAVTAGQVIGLSGNTGNSSGPHLHLSFKKDGATYVDKNGKPWPFNLINPWPLIKHLYRPDGRQWMTGYVYDYVTEGSDGEGVNFSVNLNLRTGAGATFPIIGQIPALSPIEITGAAANGYYPVASWAVPSIPPAPVGIEMAPYFLPAAGDYGDICILKNNWGQGDERQQLQRTATHAYVTKNQQWERRRIAADGIYLEMDTSPGNNQYYTIEGTAWLPLKWNPGNEHTRTETVKFFSKGNCQPTAAPYTVTNKIKFAALHSSWTSSGGVVLSNVIELQWLIAGQVEETYWFAPGKGLVAWANKAGKKSWVTEVVPVGQQGNNVREVGCYGQ